MLLQIHEYIKQQGVVSTQQLARQFRIEEQALEPMLAIWVHKGKIQPCVSKTACQTSCFRCAKPALAYFEAV